jgi:pyridoxamine 5'-phosphate oxidase
MTTSEILDFIRANPSCLLATVEGDQPRVRGMFLYRAERREFLFHTGTGKPLWGQIQANTKVELCFLDAERHKQIRVEGVVEIVTDLALKEEIVRDRPFLKPLVERFGMDMLGVFRVRPLRALHWSLETNIRPEAWVSMA